MKFYKEHITMDLRRKMAMVTAILGITACMAVTTVQAEEEKPSADASISFLSQYIWRGFELSQDSLVIQPSMTVSHKGFGFNLWGNLDTDQFDLGTNNYNETDITISYDNSVGKMGYSAGYIYYGVDEASTQELYLGFSLDTLLSPSLTIYRDIANARSWYATLGVSHSIELAKKMSLDLGAQVAYLSADDADTYAEVGTGKKYSNLHDGLLSAALAIPVGEYMSVSPELYYSFPLSSEASDLLEASSVNGDDDSFVYGGVTASFTF